MFGSCMECLTHHLEANLSSSAALFKQLLLSGLNKFFPMTWMKFVNLTINHSPIILKFSIRFSLGWVVLGIESRVLGMLRQV